MPPSDMLLQILHSQLQSQFQLGGQGGLGGTGSGATGGQVHYTTFRFDFQCIFLSRL